MLKKDELGRPSVYVNGHRNAAIAIRREKEYIFSVLSELDNKYGFVITKDHSAKHEPVAGPTSSGAFAFKATEYSKANMFYRISVNGKICPAVLGVIDVV